MRGDGNALAAALRFALEQEEQLQAGGVDLADLQEVKLEFVAGGQRIDKTRLDFGGVVDGQVFLQGESMAGRHDVS